MINGKAYQEDMLVLAEECTKSAGDGRISLDDAKKMFALVKDGGKYTQSEKDTMSYVRENFKWTEPADAWMRTEVSKWAAMN